MPSCPAALPCSMPLVFEHVQHRASVANLRFCLFAETFGVDPMRKLILPAAALAAFASPVLAEDAPAPAPQAAPLADMAEQMRDPERQREIAMMVQTMTEVLLDMPIAPLAQAAADMAGEKAEEIDPNLTLRKMAPEAGEVSKQVGRNLPHAMDAMSSMAEGLAAMAPTLREMAERMKDALPERH